MVCGERHAAPWPGPRARSAAAARRGWRGPCAPSISGRMSLIAAGRASMPVLRAPDFAHPALAQPLDQPVAPHLARLGHRGAEAVDHPGGHVGHQQHDEVGKNQRVEEAARVDRDIDARTDPDGIDDRRGGERDGRGDQREARGDRDGHTEEHDPDGHPREPEAAGAVFAVQDRRRDMVVLGRGDPVAAQHLEGEAGVELGPGGHPLPGGQTPAPGAPPRWTGSEAARRSSD